MMLGDVKRLTAIFYGLSRAEIEGPRRSRFYAWPRQVGMALCRQYSRASLPQIGSAFGRDHTTALHAVRSVALRTTQDQDYQLDVSLLCAQIEAGHISQLSLWAAKERLQFLPAVPGAAPLKHAARGPVAEAGLRWSYAKALAAVQANFAFRAPAFHTQPDPRVLPVPRVLLLRGPVFSSAEAAA